MKKNLIIISLLLTGLMAQNRAKAVDDWGSVYDSYQEAQYGKIVSEDDFQNAINAYKEYSNKKPDKKVRKKLEEKGLVLEKDKGEKKVIFEGAARQEPLLMVPVDVSHEGRRIQRGFYLAKPVSLDNEYFIRLSQGKGRIIADIRADIFKTDNFQKIAEDKEKIFSEITKNDMLKVTYSNRELILEAYLVPFAQ